MTVDGVVPGHAELGGNGGVPASKDERAGGGELADHIGRHYGMAAGPVFPVFAHRGGAAQHGGRVEGVWVADAGQPDLDAGGVEYDPCAVGAPPAPELGFAVR